MLYDTIIIGGGITGLSAAIYASRKKMKFAIIAKEFGGQFFSSGEVLNYPGIIETTGVEFSKVMEEQMKFNGVNVIEETVSEIKRKKKDFTVITDKKKYDTKSIIIATGSKPRKLNVPGEIEFANKGVAYCSICDGPIFTGKEVAIIGSGNSALEAVDFMKDIAKKIYMIVLEEKFNGHKYLIEKVVNNTKVKVIFGAKTKKIIGEKFVSSIKYEKKGKEHTLDVGGVIVEIGRLPNTEIFKDLVELEGCGHIKIDCHTNTSVPGIFAAGDCASGHEYQYIIAAGQGVMALIKAAKYLAARKD
ncbi:MAG: FAD-dependent oxidoreductase [archaeon]